MEPSLPPPSPCLVVQLFQSWTSTIWPDFDIVGLRWSCLLSRFSLIIGSVSQRPEQVRNWRAALPPVSLGFFRRQNTVRSPLRWASPPLHLLCRQGTSHGTWEHQTLSLPLCPPRSDTGRTHFTWPKMQVQVQHTQLWKLTNMLGELKRRPGWKSSVRKREAEGHTQEEMGEKKGRGREKRRERLFLKVSLLRVACHFKESSKNDSHFLQKTNLFYGPWVRHIHMNFCLT